MIYLTAKGLNTHSHGATLPIHQNDNTIPLLQVAPQEVSPHFQRRLVIGLHQMSVDFTPTPYLIRQAQLAPDTQRHLAALPHLQRFLHDPLVAPFIRHCLYYGVLPAIVLDLISVRAHESYNTMRLGLTSEQL